MKWFTEGYSKYFYVYPEWTVPSTDFLRPGVNLLVHLNYLIFGSHYFLYFVVFYAAQLWLCALAILIAQRFGVPSPWLYVLGALTAISPAFVSYGLTIFNFQFDVWCGLFAVLSFYLLLRRWYGLAILSLTLAIFTKEAALYAPIAACVTVYLDTRRKLLAGLMLLPLATWFAVRKFVFLGSATHLYALPTNSLKSLLLGVARGVLVWPLGTVDDHTIADIVHQHSIASHIPDLLTMSVNLVLWAIFCVFAAQFFRFASEISGISAIRATKEDSPAGVTLAIWLAGALSFGVIVGPGQRFGGSIYPFELIFAVLLLHRCSQRKNKIMATVLLASLGIAFLWNALGTLRRRDPNQLVAMHGMSELIAMVRHHAKDADSIYVLNSPASYSAPQSIAALAGTPSEMVILNEFMGCGTSSGGSTSLQRTSPTTVHIVSTLPPCAQYLFDEVYTYKLAMGLNGIFPRDHFAAYTFPDGRITSYGVRDGSVRTIDFGNRLDIELTPPASGSYIVLYYDWTTGEYRCAGDHCNKDT